MKIDSLKERLASESIDAAVFVSDEFDPQIFYLVGYDGAGILVVPKDKDPFLIVHGRDESRAKRSQIDVRLRKGSIVEELRTALTDRKICLSSLGVDSERISMAKSLSLHDLGVELRDVSPILSGLRSIKDDFEADVIREACKITDGIMSDVINSWSEFQTEADVASFIEMKARKIGLPCPFHTIVASGKNASDPHHRPTMARLASGPVVIDFGVCFRGYCSDITRTVCVGPPSDEVKEAYELVRRAQDTAISMIKPGVSCKELDAEVRSFFGLRADLFIHGLGHGLGIEVHESPTINARSQEVLKKGMVITIEPGVYTREFGIRIEDDVLVTEDGYEILTRIGRNLIIL